MKVQIRDQRCSSQLIPAAVFASGESAVLSFVTWLSGAEQSGLRGPSTENQEAKQAALLCIKVKCCSFSSLSDRCPKAQRSFPEGFQTSEASSNQQFWSSALFLDLLDE